MGPTFIDTEDDMSWLLSTHLRGVPLPTKYANPQAAVLEGNEDSPSEVHLYVSAEPLYTDDYLRITFHHEPPIYCMSEEMDGRTGKPKRTLQEKQNELVASWKAGTYARRY